MPHILAWWKWHCTIRGLQGSDETDKTKVAQCHIRTVNSEQKIWKGVPTVVHNCHNPVSVKSWTKIVFKPSKGQSINITSGVASHHCSGVQDGFLQSPFSFRNLQNFSRITEICNLLCWQAWIESLRLDTVQAGMFFFNMAHRCLPNHTWNHETKNQEETETTYVENQGNQPKSMKSPWKTRETSQNPWKPIWPPWKPRKPTENHEKPETI